MTNVPNFPSCAAPSGSLIADYNSGTHGIVGSTSVYTGSDRVYQVTGDTLVQCFCAENGQGIQTNWWKASSLSQEQVQTLIAQGWYYIQDGDLWGLSADPYVAKNNTYSCLPSASNPPTTSTTSTGSSAGGGEGQSASGSVLGLAATGNTLTLIVVFTVSLAFIVAGAMRLMGSRHEKTV